MKYDGCNISDLDGTLLDAKKIIKYGRNDYFTRRQIWCSYWYGTTTRINFQILI